MLRPADSAGDLCTFDDFCHLVGDGQKADLIDGVIHMASPDSRRADKMTSFVHHLMVGFIEQRGLGGEVFGSRFAFKLSQLRAPEPDVAYVVPERLSLVNERCMNGGPDIAVEIVARESRQRDYQEKRQLYQEAGVAEYWILDPIQARAEFLRWVDGQYVEVPLESGNIFRSQVLPGFWLVVRWLLSYPLPPVSDCLRKLGQ